MRPGSVVILCHEVEENQHLRTRHVRCNEAAGDRLARAFQDRIEVSWPEPLRVEPSDSKWPLLFAQRHGAEFLLHGSVSATTTGVATTPAGASVVAYPFTLRVELRLWRIGEAEPLVVGETFADVWNRPDSIAELVKKRVGQQVREIERLRQAKGW